MKEAILVSPRKFEIKESPMPVIGKDDVLIKPVYVGVCGSDLHMYDGSNALVKLPIRPGHEFSGRIVDKGSNVTNHSIGDLATVEPTTGCMACEPCLDDRRNNCDSFKVIGCHSDGAFAEYTSVPGYTVHKTLAPFPDKEYNAMLAALSEPAAVGIHSARRSGIEAYPDQRYFVIGAGVIGMMAMSALKYLSGGRAEVTASDLSAERLELAKRFGFADHTIIPVHRDPIEFTSSVRASGQLQSGYDSVIDAACFPSTLIQAFHLAKKGSGRITHLSTADYSSAPVSPLPIMRFELSVTGSRTYNRDDFEKALDMLAETRLKEILATKRTDNAECVKIVGGLDSIVDAFEIAQSAKNMKVMIKME